MKHLFEYWDQIRKKLCSKHSVLFLDYDGTLTPITDTPDKAVFSSETRRLLKKIIKNSKTKLAIISGRALKNIKKMVGIEGIVYVGNHGLEIEGPQIKFESPVSLRYKAILQHMKEELNTNFSTISGVLVEDKGLSLAIHYRLVDERQLPQVKTIFHQVTIPYSVRNKIKIKSGNKVFEIGPPSEWDKGKVTLWLLGRWEFGSGDKEITPIYIGDDVTDEDAFKALRKRGITILVGKPKRSYAQYYLKNTAEVKEFLYRILE